MPNCIFTDVCRSNCRFISVISDMHLACDNSKNQGFARKTAVGKLLQPSLRSTTLVLVFDLCWLSCNGRFRRSVALIASQGCEKKRKKKKIWLIFFRWVETANYFFLGGCAGEDGESRFNVCLCDPFFFGGGLITDTDMYYVYMYISFMCVDIARLELTLLTFLLWEGAG